MKANINTEVLPKFEVRVLDAAEISAVSGGMFTESLQGDGTAGTESICHVDGTTDSN